MSGSVGSSSNYTLIDLVGQTSAQVFASKGYLINSGFQNKAGNSSLAFSITPLSVNFGLLEAKKISYDSLIFTASSGEFPGLEVFVSQNKPLSTAGGAQIPDTICNASLNKICAKDLANIWTNSDSYGFGFNLQGNAVPADFKSSDFFRPFASLSNKEQAVKILESTQKKATLNAKMTLKLNVSKNQPVGIYQNVLNFTVLPGI